MTHKIRHYNTGMNATMYLYTITHIFNFFATNPLLDACRGLGYNTQVSLHKAFQIVAAYSLQIGHLPKLSVSKHRRHTHVQNDLRATNKVNLLTGCTLHLRSLVSSLSFLFRHANTFHIFLTLFLTKSPADVFAVYFHLSSTECNLNNRK